MSSYGVPANTREVLQSRQGLANFSPSDLEGHVHPLGSIERRPLILTDWVLTMASTKDSGPNWAVTRMAQAALFWGVLLLVVSILDLIGKLDVLSTVQASVPADLEFLVEPGVAFILTILALGAIWLASPSPASGTEDGEETPARTNSPSVLREASIPLFLALVCGVAVGGFEWKQTGYRPTVVAQHTQVPPGQALSGTIRHRPRTSTGAYGKTVNVSYSETQDSEGEKFVARWVPVGDVDQTSMADTAGESNPLAGQLPADPRPAIRAYAYDGAVRILKSGQMVTDTDTLEHKLYGRLDAARQARDWRRLATLSEDAIHKTPEWLTPYSLAGEAYANLGKIDRAISMLEYVEKQGQGNPDYDSAVTTATELRESLRRRYGR